VTDREDLAHLRDQAREGTCPLCGTGPWSALAKHVVKKHQVNAADLKERLGIPRSHGLNDPEVTERQRAQRREMGVSPDLIEAGRTSPRAASISVAGRRGQRRTGPRPERRKIPLADLPHIQARLDAGERYKDVAATYGVTPSAVHRAIHTTQAR
jgi:hypothetical protein